MVAEFIGLRGQELLHDVNGLPRIGRWRRDPAPLLIEFPAFDGGKSQAVFKGFSRHPKQAFGLGEHKAPAACKRYGYRRRFLCQREVGGENLGRFHGLKNGFDRYRRCGSHSGRCKTEGNNEKAAEKKTHVSAPFDRCPGAKNRRN